MKAINDNGLDLSLIKPERGDKYSPNLYRWLTCEQNKGLERVVHIYRDTDGILWIGMQDGRELMGSKLMGVLCNGAKEKIAAWLVIDAVLIQDFWPRYVADGRCAIDKDHLRDFLHAESRWQTAGDTRSCQWCGKHSQALKRWTEQVQREEWVNQT